MPLLCSGAESADRGKARAILALFSGTKREPVTFPKILGKVCLLYEAINWACSAVSRIHNRET